MQNQKTVDCISNVIREVCDGYATYPFNDSIVENACAYACRVVEGEYGKCRAYYMKASGWLDGVKEMNFVVDRPVVDITHGVNLASTDMIVKANESGVYQQMPSGGWGLIQPTYQKNTEIQRERILFWNGLFKCFGTAFQRGVILNIMGQIQKEMDDIQYQREQTEMTREFQNHIGEGL